MPSAPKKSPATPGTAKKKPTLSPEAQALAVKQRRESIEKRLLRLQAKIDKDRALLQKYTAQSETPAVPDANNTATEPVH